MVFIWKRKIQRKKAQIRQKTSKQMVQHVTKYWCCISRGVSKSSSSVICLSGLTAKWSPCVCAEGRADGEGGRVGGGRGDRGGGDPVEQEPSVPWVCCISCSTMRGLEMNLCRLCRCHFDGPPLPTYAGGQQGGHFSGFWDFSVKPDAILPASAGGQRGGRDVADGGRLQSGRGRAGAHVEQLRLSRDIFGRSVEQT